MHGMIPPDPSRANPRPVSALAEAGWAGFAPDSAREPQSRPWTLAAPASPLLLGAGMALTDAAAVMAGGLLVGGMEFTDARPGIGAILFLALLLPCLAGVAGAYAHPALFGGRRPVLTLLGAWFAGCLGLSGAAYALGVPGTLPLGIAALWLIASAPLLVIGRLTGGIILRSAERTRRRAVLVGDGAQAERLVTVLRARHDHSLRLLGVVDDRHDGAPPSGRGRSGLPHLGSLGGLVGMIRRGEVDEVVLTLPWSAEERIARVLQVLSEHPVDVRMAPDLVAYRECSPRPPEAGRLWMPRVIDRPIAGLGGVVKAVEDYALALGALAIAAVPMALIALAIRLDSPGPILFRQRRTGFNNRDFYVFKFRTMYHDAADHDARCQVTENDPRVTRVGAILRRTSLDELPQIFNILRGEMSFIGPRPHAPGTLAGGRPFQEVVACYPARHRVKPGLTGLAQVRGWRGPTETEEKLIRRVESDLEYIEKWSPWLDFAILVRTLLVVARMRNAL